jgi:hypothetical protein
LIRKEPMMNRNMTIALALLAIAALTAWFVRSRSV